ncbi:hypothetical protein MPSEU_000307400 [Mayamaea pseudoterrestris]|nr:hypothetical protein MPSEU_000307400 [Mayamaea pseudoterrestris]
MPSDSSTQTKGTTNVSPTRRRGDGELRHSNHDGKNNHTVQTSMVAVEHLSLSPRSHHQQHQHRPYLVNASSQRQQGTPTLRIPAPTLQYTRRYNDNSHPSFSNKQPFQKTAPMTVTMTLPSKHSQQKRKRKRRTRFAVLLLVLLVALCYRSFYLIKQSKKVLDNDDNDGSDYLRSDVRDQFFQRPSVSLPDFDFSIVRDGVARASESRYNIDDDNHEAYGDDDDDVQGGEYEKNEEELDHEDGLPKSNNSALPPASADALTMSGEDDEGSSPVDKKEIPALQLSEVYNATTIHQRTSTSLAQRIWNKASNLNPFARRTSTIAASTTTTVNNQHQDASKRSILFEPDRSERYRRNRLSDRTGLVYPPAPDPVTVEAKVQEMLTLYPDACFDKEPYLRIILSASDAMARRSAAKRDALCHALPTHAQVVQKYGTKPVIVGLDTCQAYRDLLMPERNDGEQLEPMPRVAGLYHCGTNALCRSLNENVKRLPRREFSPHEVPWGKHLPPDTHRLHNRFPIDNMENQERVLPIVIVRDPFFWFQSMCKARYDAMWEKEPNNRCPNFIRYAHNMTTWPVQCNTHQTSYKIKDNYTSLADMWNDWHLQYLDADYPRLMIRFEDALYRLEEVVNSIRECIGMNDTHTFKYMISRSKVHGNPTDFISSLMKQVGTYGRHRGLNAIDRKYAHETLSPRLMETFGYEQCPLHVDPLDLREPFLGWKIRREIDQGPGRPLRYTRTSMRVKSLAEPEMTESFKERFERLRQRKEGLLQRVIKSREALAAEASKLAVARSGILNG